MLGGGQARPRSQHGLSASSPAMRHGRRRPARRLERPRLRSARRGRAPDQHPRPPAAQLPRLRRCARRPGDGDRLNARLPRGDRIKRARFRPRPRAPALSFRTPRSRVDDGFPLDAYPNRSDCSPPNSVIPRGTFTRMPHTCSTCTPHIAQQRQVSDRFPDGWRELVSERLRYPRFCRKIMTCFLLRIKGS